MTGSQPTHKKRRQAGRPRPAFLSEPRYREALADARRFLTAWGAQAAAHGWTTDDLFGLDPIAPLARYDAMGLIWLLRAGLSSP